MFDEQLQDLQFRLANHELYSYIKTPDHLRIFMASHVFAVWDFMSLAKRLQIELTCTRLPWFTPVDGEKARFINEIILGEESDIGYDGHPASHFDMYRLAMADMGCSNEAFDVFAQAYHQDADLAGALKQANVPGHVADFVARTIRTALNGRAEEVASSFFFGREDAIPQMFQALLDNWGLDEKSVPRLVHYLQRHIELDGDDHGPAAMNILKGFIGDPASEARAVSAAREAIHARLALWDGILAQMKRADAAEALAYQGHDVSATV